LSGYARDKRLLGKLDVSEDQMNKTVVECLIIFPDRSYLVGDERQQIDFLQKEEIKQFLEFYKLRIKLPCINV